MHKNFHLGAVLVSRKGTCEMSTEVNKLKHFFCNRKKRDLDKHSKTEILMPNNITSQSNFKQVFAEPGPRVQIEAHMWHLNKKYCSFNLINTPP